MIVKRMGQRLMGTRKGEPSTPLCDRALARARVLSARQLPTDHVHVGGPRARSTNIRMINRRPSLLDRCPIRFTSAAALPTGEQTQCQTWGRAAQPASSMGSLSGRPLAMRLWTKPTKRWPKRIKKRAAVISAKLDRSLHIRGGPPPSISPVTLHADAENKGCFFTLRSSQLTRRWGAPADAQAHDTRADASGGLSSYDYLSM